MKKCIFLLVTVLSFILFLNNPVNAAPNKPTPILDKAQINIIEDAEFNVKVTENISVSKLDLVKNNKFECTLSRINGIDTKKLIIKLNGNTCQFNIKQGEALTKIDFPLNNVPDVANVDIEYDLKLKDNIFTIPLVVPAYPSTGKENIVSISFTAPEGNYIHSNSFPIVPNLKDSNVVKSDLANVPSHVNFEFSKEKDSVFNPFNIISFIVFLVLIVIIVRWIRMEVKKNKKQGV